MNDPDSLDRIRVEELKLSMKAEGFLKRSQIYTIADLVNYTQEDLITLDAETGQEVITALKQTFNLDLPEDDLQ